MKTRLLEKLRKKASKIYVIRRSAKGFAVFKPTDDSFWASSSSMEVTKKRCKDMMDDWINNKVIELRTKYPRKKIIHYYPW